MPTWAVIVGLCVLAVAAFMAVVCYCAAALSRALSAAIPGEDDDADF